MVLYNSFNTICGIFNELFFKVAKPLLGFLGPASDKKKRSKMQQSELEKAVIYVLQTSAANAE
jgi:hypothetical protein